MTTGREALNEIIGLLDKMAALHPSRDLREVLPDPKGLADRARLLLAAAPGEPCGYLWRYKGQEEWQYCPKTHVPPYEAERQPLYITPQPAAGWDIEAIAKWLHDETGHPDAYPNHTWPETELDDGQRAGGFVKIVPLHAQEYFRDIVRRLVTQLDRPSLRREAPAPAEGVKNSPSDRELWEAGCLTREQLKSWTGHDFAVHIAGIRKTIFHLFSLIDARPDTAEARDQIAVLAHRFWSIHPREIQGMGLTREQFYVREIAALVDTAEARLRGALEIARTFISEARDNGDDRVTARRATEIIERIDYILANSAEARYRHKKRGTIYTEIGRGFAQVSHHPIEEMTAVVVYRDAEGVLWVRNAVEFDDGRFEVLDEAR